MQLLSIYDMDKTITRAATFGPFLAYAVPRHAPWRVVLLPLVLLTTLSYALKLIDRARLKEINLGLMLGPQIDVDALRRLSKGFAVHTCKKNMLQPALDQIARDRDEGRTIMLATASYDFYVREIGALLGIAEIVATRAATVGGNYLPKIDGENCYGAAKLTLVEVHLASLGLKREAYHIRFYSDHVSDSPCLEWADEAFATSPHGPLRALAKARGWVIYDWNKA